jgi:rifampicin phosphotransferase
MNASLIFRPGQSPILTLGGKGLNLLELAELGQQVPPWFAVPAEVFPVSSDPSRGRQAILSQPLPAALQQAVRAAYKPGSCVAVRSSAPDEDSLTQSFAGLHDSFLFVRNVDGVLEAIRHVWASAYNDRSLAYRQKQGLDLGRIAVAVIVQEMIEPAVSGVMFTINPVTGATDVLVISAVYGVGEGLVSGGLDADTFTVRKNDLFIARELADKCEQFVADPAGGTRRAPVPDTHRRAATLSDEQVRQVAQAGLAVEKAYGRPQDIEFCFDAAGTLWVLQTRPVTTAAEYGPAAGNHLIWDNSNIIESYAGVTSPMTFSFIRRAYTIVYHCFAEVMGTSTRVVRDNETVFENMLGLFRGQVYYNLLNWYRLVRFFPGFAYNKQFMEAMMGVKEPAELRDEYPTPTRIQRYFVELPRLVRLVARSAWNFLRIRGWVADFEENFRQHYRSWEQLNFHRLKPHKLHALYREMEKALLWNWRAPIINDFFVMIYYGLLKKLCERWCGDATGSLQNDLLCGEGGMASTEPTRALLRLAALAQRQPELREWILTRPASELVTTVPADDRFNEFTTQFKRYLDQYGFRCMNELKLEEYSLRDRPEFLYTVLRNYLTLNRPEALDVDAMTSHEQSLRRTAEQRALSMLGPFRRIVFRHVLRGARLGVKNRENMRFARTRIYGLLRELIRALGRQFATEAILTDADDVFYLTLDECWDYVKGTAVTTNLAALAALRRAEFEVYRQETNRNPDDRFETYGMAYHKNLLRGQARQATITADGKLHGVGCCPGTVTGTVKVVGKPPDNLHLDGEILVAERTDPGWVPLYPSVSGLLIERGSILSHSAIVAREMGLPTIVGIPGLVATLQNGQRVTMDGAAGTVEILSDR